jgi:hypothetical protein
MYTPIYPVKESTMTPQDITVIIPTVAEDIHQLQETIETACRVEPSALLLVTPESVSKGVQEVIRQLGYHKWIQVLLWFAKVLFHPKIAAHAKKWDFKPIIG